MKLFKKHSNHKLRGKWYTQKEVEQYKNGKLIKTYNSATEVARKKGYAKAHISECCNGKRKTAYGYEWRYKEPEDTIIFTTTQKIYTKIIKDQEKAEMKAIKEYCRENNIIPNLIDEKELQLVISLGIEELTKRKNGEWR